MTGNDKMYFFYGFASFLHLDLKLVEIADMNLANDSVMYRVSLKRCRQSCTQVPKASKMAQKLEKVR